MRTSLISNKSNQSNQKGFGLVPVFVLLLVVGAASVIGFRVLSSHTVQSSSSVGTSPRKAPSTLKNPNDLQKASDSMTETIDTSSLDADLNSLL